MGEVESTARKYITKARNLLTGKQPAIDEDAPTVYPTMVHQSEPATEVSSIWFPPIPQKMDARTRRTEAAMLRFINSPANHLPESTFVVPVNGDGPMPMDPLDDEEVEVSQASTRRRGRNRIYATLGQLETVAA